MFLAKSGIVIDANFNTYCGTICFALVIGLSQLIISGINCIVLRYVIDPNVPGDSHILLCTIAYNVIGIQAILSHNFVNGWSKPLRLRHRGWVHGAMMVVSLIFGVIGFIHALGQHNSARLETHGKMGIATMVFAMASACVGVGALLSNQYWKIGHILFGLPTFLLSSICFIEGLLKPRFKEWAGQKLVIILVTSAVFYTIFVFLMAFIKFILRIVVKLREDKEDDDEDDD